MAASTRGPTHSSTLSSSPSFQPSPATGILPALQSLTSWISTNHTQQQQHPGVVLPPVQLSTVPGTTPSTNPHLSGLGHPGIATQGLKYPVGATLTPERTLKNAAAPWDTSNTDPVMDSGAVDLLLETMDAWEEAVMKRMHSAVQDAVRGARCDVMQVCTQTPVLQLSRCLVFCRTYFCIRVTTIVRQSCPPFYTVMNQVYISSAA